MFCATRSSILRVTSCSTLSVLCPGHGVTTATCRTGMSGSLRLGIAAYAQNPQAMTPTSKTHDTWRFSTKKRVTLLNFLHDIAWAKQIRPRRHDSLAAAEAVEDRYLVTHEGPRPHLNTLDRGNSSVLLLQGVDEV